MKILKRMLCYAFGFFVINQAVTYHSSKEFIYVTVGGIILIISTLLFQDNE